MAVPHPLAARRRRPQEAGVTAPAAPPPAPRAALRGQLVDLRRHPVKGFTAEALASVALEEGRPFPHDRLFAVEAGDSGFDPAAPSHVSKFKFAVLANTAAVARVRTLYDEATCSLEAEAKGAPPFSGRMDQPADRAAFVEWLKPVLGEEAPEAPLRVIPGAGWRFFDAPDGHISLINLASVRDLGEQVGAALDPLRFRANLYVEGWPAWAEMDLPAGALVTAGGATLTVGRPIRRCAAVHVDPTTAVRDQDLVRALHTAYGHMFCGVYLQVAQGGVLSVGDRVEAEA